MTDPGERPHLVMIQRATVSEDDHGGETRTWHTTGTAWAKLAYGTGQERRESAQESASQGVTMMFDWSPALEALLMTDRLVLFDTAWDVRSKAVIGINREVHVTAVANMDGLEIDS